MFENNFIAEIGKTSIISLKYDPVFSIENDIAEIKARPIAGHNSHKTQNRTCEKKEALPYLRAYILTKEYVPMAIFNNLPYDGFEVLIRVLFCIDTKKIKGGDGYFLTDLGNAYRGLIKSKRVKLSFRLAFFNSDEIIYHLLIPTDLAVYLCSRFCDYDIIDHTFWDLVTQYE